MLILYRNDNLIEISYLPSLYYSNKNVENRKNKNSADVPILFYISYEITIALTSKTNTEANVFI